MHSWSVRAHTLQQLVEWMGVDCSRLTVVKVDIEGAEALLPEALSMVLPHCGDPSVLLSLHTFAWIESLRKGWTPITYVSDHLLC